MASAINNHAAFIWGIAELLRGDYKQSDYGKVVLPFTLLRRLDCVLEETKPKVLKEYVAKKNISQAVLDPTLKKKSGFSFYNVSPFVNFEALLGDSNNLRKNLNAYIKGFSDNVRDVFEHYDFHAQIDKLDSSNLLYQVVQKFAGVDLHPQALSNTEMGAMFEELIRRFAELSNETAGEHYTPREVIRLMVSLLFTADDDALSRKGTVRTIYDPTAGTGGMLSVAEDYLQDHNPEARLTMFGQELNPESYAICKADMLIKGQNVENIIFGNTLSDDGLPAMKFDYMLSNPPFGVEWKKVEKAVRDEHQKRGFGGRFGAGLPRISDGSLLFLMHLLSKMRPVSDGGSRIGIVFNGSPLFTGGAGSGESEIRRWIIEQDFLEAIIALPTDMFYNTGISTYVWLLTNRKEKQRKGKIQLIQGVDFFQKMRKSLGSKRKELGAEDIARITKLYGAYKQGEHSKIFKNEDFGYRTITVERPLLDAKGKPEKDKKGKVKGDANLRDTENVPLTENIETYFKREVLPHVPDAWIDHDKTKVGYEIPFNRHFYKYVPPRPLEVIDAELKDVTADILKLLTEVAA